MVISSPVSASAVLLGRTSDTGSPVTLQQEKRLGGLYLIGKTGSGKTTLLVNMILQDIAQGMGLCFIDPNGDAITDILRRFPDTRNIDDVILLNPLDEDFSFGLNMFSCDPTNREQVSLTVNYVLEVFAKLFTEEGSFNTEAPNMERTLRNAAYTLIDNFPHFGTTLTELPLLIDTDAARAALLENILPAHSLARRFWEEYARMERLQDKLALTGSTMSRVERFLSNEFIRHIVGQTRSTLNLSELMLKRKIILVPLPRTQPQLTSLVGGLLIAQIAQAAFLRGKMPESDRTQFNLYCDEYQRFSTPTFAELLAEVRKFKIATCVAHQWRAQLDLDNRKATLNAANLVVFQVSGEDGQELAKQFDHKPLPGEPQIQYKRVFSPTPVNDMLLDKPHSQKWVTDFFAPYRKMVQIAKDVAFVKHTKRIPLVFPKPGHMGLYDYYSYPSAGSAQVVIPLLNGWLHRVMAEKRVAVMPVEVFDNAALCSVERLSIHDRQKFFVGVREIITVRETITDDTFLQYVTWLLELEDVETHPYYTSLWLNTVEQLPALFDTFAQAARVFFSRQVPTKLEAFFKELEITHDKHDGIRPIMCDVKYARNPAVTDYYSLDFDFGSSLQESQFERLQKIHDLPFLSPFDLKGLLWEKKSVFYWQLKEGQEPSFLSIPAVQTYINSFLAKQQKAFETWVLGWRAVLSALIAEPVETLSSVVEEKRQDVPSSEVLTRIANTLANPEKPYTARCKLSGGGEYLLETLWMPEPASLPVYLSRLTRIQQNTRTSYMKPRETIEQEIADRQALLLQKETAHAQPTLQKRYARRGA